MKLQKSMQRPFFSQSPKRVGSGRGAVADIGLERLDDAHGRWALAERRQLGSDSFAAYSRLR
mgnify:CR=1 FL=1